MAEKNTTKMGEKKCVKMVKKKCARKKGRDLLQFKSSLTSFEDFIKLLKFHRKHLDALERTPFSVFFNAFIQGHVKVSMKKMDSVLLEIIETYQKSNKCFVIGGKEILLVPSDFELIYGITSGVEPIVLGHKGKLNSRFINKWFADEDVLNTKSVKAAIWKALEGDGEEDFRDVARLLVLFVIGSLFFTKSGLTIQWGLVEYVEDLNKVCRYDWSKLFCESLNTSIEKNNPNRVTGCVLTLLYWLCEHSTMMDSVDETIKVPRFLKWDLKKVCRALSKKGIRNIESTQICPDVLEKTEEEHKLYEGVLILDDDDFIDVSIHYNDDGCSIDNRSIINEEFVKKLEEENRKVKRQIGKMYNRYIQLDNEIKSLKEMKDAEINVLKQEKKELEEKLSDYIINSESQSIIKDTTTKRTRKGKEKENMEEVIDLDFIEENPTKKQRYASPFTSNNEVFKNLSNEDCEILNQMIDVRKDLSTTVWESNRNFVTLYDICNLIEEKELSNCVIDSYCEILFNQQLDMQSFFFISNAMAHIKDSTSIHVIRKSFDDLIYETNRDYKCLHFPLICCNRNGVPNHWTLLIHRKEDGWYYYNSMRPRRGKDHYKDDAITMMKYVEKKLKGLDFRVESSLNVVKDCLQQESEAVDCGAFICYFMQQISSNKPIEKLSRGGIREFRAKMVHEFLVNKLK